MDQLSVKSNLFSLKSSFQPTGDQPAAIKAIARNVQEGVARQTLLGVTGSGKTFTMAHVIQRMQLPTLVISHNKTLAAQLYEEFRRFFPESAVHYFVSYYDYYQPEAYIPQTDTYIEKDAKINEVIDALRHASTSSLLTRKDVIIVASVSCIYGVGSPEEYHHASLTLLHGERITAKELTKNLTLLQYVRNPYDPRQGHFRVHGDIIEIFLPSGEEIVTIELSTHTITSLTKKSSGQFDAPGAHIDRITVFPAKHFITPHAKLKLAIREIKKELAQQFSLLTKEGKILEAARIRQRTLFDLSMLEHTAYVNGIENYSRHLDFRPTGSPPYTLLDYFHYAYGDKFLTFIDESHATIPQLRGMYHGDRARKDVLVAYGFRLPSARDNRPLMFAEFNQRAHQVIYVSATPGVYEHTESDTHITQQLIRPTGILDPKIEIRSAANQFQDLCAEIRLCIARGQRALVLTLTKRLAEDIAAYLKEREIKAEYLHADIKTLARPEILNNLRAGIYDVLVGINLLREGLDLPEVSFIGILDADKEGFLRNETTLLQIIGRAARHTDGKVIFYADHMTDSMKRAVAETARRRTVQEEYNRSHHITPRAITKEISSTLLADTDKKQQEEAIPQDARAPLIRSLTKEMQKAARAMDFERAAKLRDRIHTLKNNAYF